MASHLLSAPKRRGAFAVYAFCRSADDAVDLGATDGVAVQSWIERRRLAVDRAFRGDGQTAADRELAWAMNRFEIPAQPFYELLDGVARDTVRVSYADWTDLERYCQGVASSVGELCTYVFGVSDSANLARAAMHARTLGVALQLTNILRDVGEDARRARVYLPAADLTGFDLTPATVLDGSAHQHRRWPDFMRAQIDRARSYYRGAQPGYALLAPDAQACARACAVGYAGILDEIERNGFDVYQRRASLGWLKRGAALTRAYLNRRTDADTGPISLVADSPPRYSHV